MPDRDYSNEPWYTEQHRQTEELINRVHALALDRARARRTAAGEPMGDDLWAMFLTGHPELRGDDA